MQVSTTNAPVSEQHESHVEVTDGESIRALVIDDEVVTRSLVHACLSKAGWSVSEAASGEEGLEKYSDFHPDVIVLDLLMPGQDGFEVCQEFRNRGAVGIPILIMTGLEDEDAVHRAYEAGATDFVSKPIDYTVLPYRLRWMLGASRSMSQVKESERRLRKAQQIARLGSWELQTDGAALSASDEALRIFGIARREFDGNYASLLRHVHPTDRLRVNKLFLSALDGVPLSLEHRIVGGSNDVRFVRQEVEIVSSGSDGSRTVFGTIQDVTDFRRTQQQLFQLYYFDRLTGLPNQFYAERQLQQLASSDSEASPSVVVMAVKVMNMKRINGSFGRAVGDQTLKTVAETIRALTRARSLDTESAEPIRDGAPLNLVARIGVSEFGIVRQWSAEQDSLEALAQKLNERLSESIEVNGHRFAPEPQIGIAVADAHASDLLSVIDNARHARDFMDGRAKINFHSSDLNQRVADNFKLETALSSALDREEFTVYYQPKVSLKTDQVVGVEALVRWRHPERGLVPPSEFIPLAEQTGLILDLGEWVLRQAALDLEMNSKSLGGLRLAFNLSPLQFSDLDLVPRLSRLLDEVSIPSSLIELEVTERALMDEKDVGEQVVKDLKALGVKVALDDFGTGISSMNYLKNFPLDLVKIDRSFIQELVSSDYSRALVASLVELSQLLGKTVVAEGVETDKELSVVNELKCDEAQGYHLCKPLPIDELVAWVDQRSQGQGVT